MNWFFRKALNQCDEILTRLKIEEKEPDRHIEDATDHKSDRIQTDDYWEDYRHKKERMIGQLVKSCASERDLLSEKDWTVKIGLYS